MKKEKVPANHGLYSMELLPLVFVVQFLVVLFRAYWECQLNTNHIAFFAYGLVAVYSMSAM